MAKKTKKKNKLSPIRVRFCDEFMQSLNATQAYFNVYKCTMAAAIAASSRLLTNVKIQDYIQKARDKEAKTAGVTQQMLIDEYKKMAFSNLQDYVTDSNNIKNLAELPRELTAAVESIQSDIRHDGGDSDGYTEKVKIKLSSKLNALNDLGKHLGLFAEDNKQKAALTLVDIAAQIQVNNGS